METKKHIKTIIIEDDASSTKLLKEFLKNFDFVDVVGEATTYQDAEALIKSSGKLDLIFMDIDLNGASGLDLITHINPQTRILFITGYADFAVKAFEFNTIDYIVKPISFERLKKALNRVDIVEKDADSSHDKNHENHATHSNTRFTIDNMILMNIDNELKFIKIKDINYIEAKGNYTTVFLLDGSSFTTYGLIKVWDDKLPHDDFFRIHRSTIVNLHSVTKIEKGTYDTGILYLKGISKPFEVSRNYFSIIKNTFKLTSNL